MSFMRIRAGRRADINRQSAVILPRVNKMTNGGYVFRFMGLRTRADDYGKNTSPLNIFLDGQAELLQLVIKILSVYSGHSGRPGDVSR